ncbi:hypothetical protein M514_03739 [Trichuris suis]|uniref:Uncharacterized protein n=1 Tax=Trichuris suis TaxID=68888 RepID=A0A085NGX9_9BILA|nr:hypothetical protein M513_03739 [Trichuris suis]KFD68725.1 hypothetical protein M514_03739 [Trichuris suis]
MAPLYLGAKMAPVRGANAFASTETSRRSMPLFGCDQAATWAKVSEKNVQKHFYQKRCTVAQRHHGSDAVVTLPRFPNIGHKAESLNKATSKCIPFSRQSAKVIDPLAQ